MSLFLAIRPAIGSPLESDYTYCGKLTHNWLMSLRLTASWVTPLSARKEKNRSELTVMRRTAGNGTSKPWRALDNMEVDSYNSEVTDTTTPVIYQQCYTH